MNGVDTITIPKRFDYSVGAEFNTAFIALLEKVASDGKLVKLDCAKMEYIDSAGIGLLVMSFKKAQQVGAKIIMINVRASAKETLMLANVQRLIDIS